MNIKIVKLVSDISAKEVASPFIKKVNEKLAPWSISENTKNADIVLFAIITGGTENKFKKVFQKYAPPYFILFNEFNNSLPAAMEILSFLNMQGLEGELIDINKLFKQYFKKRLPLAGKTLGSIGKPSDWLIASTYPDSFYKKHFKLNVKYIPISKVIETFNRIPDKTAQNAAAKFAKKANAIYEINSSEITKAFKFYLALKDVIKKYNLNFITVRCFDIIKPLNTTGCVALSLLNSEDITAGCEGDIPATLTMELAKLSTGEIPFMANVSYLKETKNNLLVNFAHCTVATNIVKAFNLRTHFESGKGVGIQGIFEEGPGTVVRIGGKLLKEAVVIPGYIRKSKFSTHRCRSQLNFETDKKFENYFLKTPLGNHHIIIRGNYEQALKNFLSNVRIKTIEKEVMY
jgi:L-fucose isomerase-like protein